MLALSWLVTRIWIIHLLYFCFIYKEGLDSTYIWADIVVNAFYEVLDSNLGLENGCVVPGFVGLSSVIAGKFWEVAFSYGGYLLFHLPFVFSCLPIFGDESITWNVMSAIIACKILCSASSLAPRDSWPFFRCMLIVPIFHGRYLLDKGPWLLNNTFSYISYYYLWCAESEMWRGIRLGNQHYTKKNIHYTQILIYLCLNILHGRNGVRNFSWWVTYLR